MQPGTVFTGFSIAPKIFRQFSFPSGKIRAYKLSAGIFSGFSDFNPKFFPISNFHGKIFPAKRISRPKKVRVSGCHGLRPGERFTTVVSVSCQTDNLFSNFRARFFFFFQLSTGKFSGFSNFEPKKIRPTNFRTGNFCSEKISDRTSGTRSAGSVLGGLHYPRRETCDKGHFFQLSRRSF